MTAHIEKNGFGSSLAEPDRAPALLDKAGAAASLACAVHCVVLPIATALLPILGLAWLDNVWVDRSFLGGVIVVAALAHPKGYRTHRRCLPAVLAACGLLGMSIAITLWESNELHHYLMAFAGLLVAVSHFMNRHWCKCACHHNNSSTQKQSPEQGHTLMLGLLVLAAGASCAHRALAQGETTSAIVGRVTDATHAWHDGRSVRVKIKCRGFGVAPVRASPAPDILFSGRR